MEDQAGHPSAVVTASEILETCEQVSRAAEEHGQQQAPEAAAVVANINANTQEKIAANHKRVQDARKRSAAYLQREPTVARVVVEDEYSNQYVFYFSRATPVSVPDAEASFASYHAPVGRLASLSVGDEFQIKRNGVPVDVEVVENTHYKPKRETHGWDGFDAIFRAEQYHTFSVGSLQGYLNSLKSSSDEGDILAEVLENEERENVISEKIRRSTIDRIALKDRPILDKYQDDIFRRPIDQSIALIGPPGTGKTTTLIKRLRQKSDKNELAEDESGAVDRGRQIDGEAHADSWIMFTPTELLRLYVKEAFVEEGIPAADRHIQIWDDQRRQLAREKFSILKHRNRGRFVMKAAGQVLEAACRKDQISWFDDYEAWEANRFWENFDRAVDIISRSSNPEISSIGSDISRVTVERDTTEMSSTFFRLLPIADQAADHSETLRRKVRDRLDENLRGILRSDRDFLDKLASVVDEMSSGSEDEDEDEDGVEGEEEESVSGRRDRARRAFHNVVRRAGIALANGRRRRPSSVTSKILKWMGNAAPSSEELLEIGKQARDARALALVARPIRGYLNGLAGRYAAFRRARQGEGRWYLAGSRATADVEPIEVDLMLARGVSVVHDVFREGIR